MRYVTDAAPGVVRRRYGKGFRYIDADGRAIRDPDEIQRINALAIPPAWTDVWICPSPDGHILATGRDAKGRKQYRYHPKWRKVRDESKFERTISFAEGLPALRRQVRKDMAKTSLPKEKVVATVVTLLDCCFARIGNEEYAKANGSFGLTTLRNKHAKVKGSTLHLHFKGKGGKEHEAEIDDPRVAYIVKRCRDIPGQQLFQYIDDEGGHAPISSGDVNDYLRDITGAEFSAKDFRTWAATVTCATALAPREVPESEREQNAVVLEAVDEVATTLGNTRTVARASYIHPDVIAGYLDGDLGRAWKDRPSGQSGERFVLSYLKKRARKARRAA